MGMIFRFACKECDYQESFFIGPGFLTARTGKWNELFSCPKCDNLSIRETAADTTEDDSTSATAAEEVQICEKCNSIMIQVKNYRRLPCPNCHCKDGMLMPSGYWD